MTNKVDFNLAPRSGLRKHHDSGRKSARNFWAGHFRDNVRCAWLEKDTAAAIGLGMAYTGAGHYGDRALCRRLHWKDILRWGTVGTPCRLTLQRSFKVSGTMHLTSGVGEQVDRIALNPPHN